MSVIVFIVAGLVAVGCWWGHRVLGSKAEKALVETFLLLQNQKSVFDPFFEEKRKQAMKYSLCSGICRGNAMVAGVTAVGAIIYSFLQ